MSYRAVEIQQALDWIRMARDLAQERGTGVFGPLIVQRLDIAVQRLQSALDIKPSEAAIDEIVASQRDAA